MRKNIFLIALLMPVTIAGLTDKVPDIVAEDELTAVYIAPDTMEVPGTECKEVTIG